MGGKKIKNPRKRCVFRGFCMVEVTGFEPLSVMGFIAHCIGFILYYMGYFVSFAHDIGYIISANGWGSGWKVFYL